ncbi:imm11 family protein [Pyxidicoccus trucidator]|uniref:imm11 family protein n=1 Tax=Pyxidicoccus trucidator TaxID=2709662 RepID=UPI0013DC14CB|nr:DUF1629 domain-containing protein [Pyxidicoccus trucidator]
MQSEYFIIERAASNSHPLLGWAQSGSAFYKGKPVTVTEPIRLRLNEPIPAVPVMVDHHSLPDPVFSTRLRDVLEPLQLHRVQLVPADVRVKEDDVRRYWLLHVFNEIACLDRQRSVFDSYSDGDVADIEKLVLHEETLRELPLEKRLVFILAEVTSMCLFHRSVVDRVLSLSPPAEGVRFIPVEAWNDSAGFS